MNKLNALIKKNLKETLRDPLCTIFNLAFPVILFVILNVVFVGSKVIPENFMPQNFVPGICVLAYCFTMLTCSLMVAGDKTSSFMARIIVAPVKFSTYVISVIISNLPVIAIQTILLYGLGFIFGLNICLESFITVFYLLFSGIFYILLGTLIGLVVKNVKNAGPTCSILINVISLLGGVFLPVSILSGALKTIVNILPFIHTTQIASQVFVKGLGAIYPHVLIILGYSLMVIAFIYIASKKINKNY